MGEYSFTGNSTIRMTGYLHNDDFDPVEPNRNRLSQGLKSDGEEQFGIIVSLQSNHRYVLIVAPRTPETTGTFSIRAAGPAMVSLKSVRTTPMQSIGEYLSVELPEVRIEEQMQYTNAEIVYVVVGDPVFKFI